MLTERVRSDWLAVSCARHSLPATKLVSPSDVSAFPELTMLVDRGTEQTVRLARCMSGGATEGRVLKKACALPIYAACLHALSD